MGICILILMIVFAIFGWMTMMSDMEEAKSGWQFSSRVFISGEKWMSDHDTMADFKHPVSVDLKGVESLDAFRGMEAEFKRRYEERQAKLKNYFMEQIPKVIKHDIEGEVNPHQWAEIQKTLFDADQKAKTQGGFTPRATGSEFKASDAIALLYGITIPFMTGIAAGTGSPWNEALGLGIIWPLWIPFEVGKAIGRVLELLP